MTFPPSIQTIEDGDTSGLGKTFGSADGWDTPVSGNLILVFTAYTEGNRSMVVPTGYTEIDVSSGGGAQRPKVGAFYKVSEGDESTVVVEWSAGSGQWASSVQEFDIDDIEFTPQHTGNGGNQANTTSKTSGETTSVEGFAFALFVSEAQNGETPSATNGFTHDRVMLSGGSGDLCIDVFHNDAYRDTADTYSTTASWTSSEDRAAICVAAEVKYTDGEKLRDSQRSSSYRVLNGKGQIAYTPADEVVISGKNRGQAKKLMKPLVVSKGPYNLKVEG